ncbi:MAG: hypothetical protein Q9P01_01125 [Anaerolineae bacterium]|nr:hypothetical protein [Anaerolineae bacterium]MDQ7033466.1 hypothetical protein [Anaerolineae bacterium]
MSNETPEKQSSTTEKKRVVRWRCPNCGQTLFTAPNDEPPDICNYCRDMTTWQRVDDENNNQSQS